jgi:flagellar hook protein FlgE
MGLTTFSTGLSGLATNSEGLSVVGNNLANLNTTGFKASDISFTDVLGQTFSTPSTPESGGLNTIGLGAQVGSVRQNMTQGTLATTNNPLDVAIQGKGFLVVKDANGQFYTRAGNLHLDANGFLVSDDGSKVQGYARNPATGLIDPNQGLADLNIPAGIDNPVPTSNFEVAMNLDANAVDGTHFNTSIQVFDSLGNSHLATLSMQKHISTGATPATTWSFDITIPNNEIAGVPATNTQQFSLITGAVATATPSAGTLAFDNTGKLTFAYIGAAPSPLPALGNLTIPPSSVTLANLADGGVLSNTGITWKLLSAGGTPNITAYGSPSAVTSSTQDGAAPGSLSDVAIASDGTISAVFSNGKTTDVAQIVLAQFNNVNGLVPEGGGKYAESTASGALFLSTPGVGGSGQLTSGALEQSNVDLATELTKIITFQRGYQANAKIITVTDQIMQDTLNMKAQ